MAAEAFSLIELVSFRYVGFVLTACEGIRSSREDEEYADDKHHTADSAQQRHPFQSVGKHNAIAPFSECMNPGGRSEETEVRSATLVE